MSMKKLLMSATMLFALGCFAQTSGAGSSTPDQGSAGSSSTTPQSSSSGSMSSPSSSGSNSGSMSSGAQGSYGSQSSTSTSSQTPSSDTSTASTSGKQKGDKTIKGCIAGSSGSYTLQEKGGKKSVNLQSSQDLSAHVGHEVKLHGRWEKGASMASANPSGSSSDTTSGSMASNSGSRSTSSSGVSGTSNNNSGHAHNKDQEKTFVVDSVDMVSDQCKSGGNASSASNSSNPNSQTGTSPR